jgi:hypothetical protein
MIGVLLLIGTALTAFIAVTLFLAAALSGECRAPRPMADADFECWGDVFGPPLSPSRWPKTGRRALDGEPIRLSPSGEFVVLDPLTGEIRLARDYVPRVWGP